MLANLFAPPAMKISAGLIAGLLIALAFVTWRADNLSGRLERSQAALVTEKAGHALTRASVDTLEAEVNRCMADARERDEAARVAQEEATRLAETNDRLARTTQQAVDRLRELAEVDGGCIVDSEIRELAEGL